MTAYAKLLSKKSDTLWLTEQLYVQYWTHEGKKYAEICDSRIKVIVHLTPETEFVEKFNATIARYWPSGELSKEAKNLHKEAIKSNIRNIYAHRAYCFWRNKKSALLKVIRQEIVAFRELSS